jgi:hypothetical protein
MAETRNENRILIGKSSGKPHWKRPRRGWEDNIYGVS